MEGAGRTAPTEFPQSPNNTRRSRSRGRAAAAPDAGLIPVPSPQHIRNLPMAMGQELIVRAHPPVDPQGAADGDGNEQMAVFHVNTRHHPFNPLPPTIQRGPGGSFLFDSSPQASSSRLSGPSPDEMVIQARGRRSLPVTFSPDIHHTPLRQMHRQRLLAQQQAANGGQSQGVMNRLLLPTRTSPRKRLQLSDSPPSKKTTGTDNSLNGDAGGSLAMSNLFNTPSPDKSNKRSPISKKIRGQLNFSSGNLPGTPESSGTSPLILMKALTPDQLVGIIGKMLERHPEMEEEVSEMMPIPDLKHFEDKLLYLKRNIFKALPSTRLESRTDSLAYNRVSTHLAAFKKTLLDQMKQLVDAQQWSSVVDYTMMAWGYIKATPTWDNPPHNNIRKQCFKTLSSNCLAALKKGDFASGGGEIALELKKKLGSLERDSEDLLPCVKFLEQVLHNTGNNSAAAAN